MDRTRPTAGVPRPVAAEVADLDAGELERRIEENWVQLAAHLVQAVGGSFQDDGHVARFWTGLPSGFLNGVLRVRLEPGEVAAAVAGSLGFFARRAGAWRWVVGPDTTPPDLSAHLDAAGIARFWRLTAMTLDLARTEPSRPAGSEARVREVLTSADLEDWLHVRRTNLGLDEGITAGWRTAHAAPGLGVDRPLRHLVARLAGEPVGAATVFLGAGVAGVYHVDTVPAARNRGAGTGLTLAALAIARERGYRYVVLSATELGERIYRRLGFTAGRPFTIHRGPDGPS